MQSKLTFSVVVLSVVAAIAFAARWTYEQNHTHTLVIATGGKQGEYYAFARALATVLARHQPNIQVKVQETDGSVENLELIDQGKAQLAIVQSDSAPTSSVRAIAYLFPEVFHLIARSESGIDSVDDLRGKRVALMPKASGSYKLFTELIQHYKLTQRDFTALPMQPSDAYTALTRGKVDALFRVIAVGNPATAELLRRSHARLIPIDQGDSLRLYLPFLEKATIPKGTYDGGTPIPPNDVAVVGVRAVLVTDAGLDNDVARVVTQTLFEFRSELVQLYPRAALIEFPEAAQNLGLPLHPGAKAYYAQDQPGFLEKNADSIGVLVSVGALLASLLWQVHLWFKGRQKNRADFYNLKILDLIERSHEIATLKELEDLRQQLFEIFRKVVEDLDLDRITPESFQSFAFTWEMAIATIRHREIILTGLNPVLPPSTRAPINPPP